MKSLHRLALVATVSLMATFVLAGTALAQYPVAGSIDCDASTVVAGDAFTCSAGGFLPGSEVSVTASGSTTDDSPWTFETTATADQSGVASASIQVPDNATGSITVTFAGLDAEGNARVLSNSTAVTVVQPAAAGGDDAAADLPATGSDMAGGVIAMTALVTVGAALLLVTRRRTREHVDA